MKFLTAIFLFVTLAVNAASPTNKVANAQFVLAWDRSPDDRMTNGVTYSIYATNVVNNVTNSLSVGGITNNTVGIFDASPGTWTFWATARLGNIESVPSNLVLVSVPKPPSNMKTVVLQYSATITGPFTDAIFLKLLPLP